LEVTPAPPLTVTYISGDPPGLKEMTGAVGIPDPTSMLLLPPEKIPPPVVAVTPNRSAVPACEQTLLSPGVYTVK
jgi:hypothetical protein